MATKTKAPSRSTKPTTKKKGLFSRVNFSSRKTQFLLSILIIAVAGAGYFTVSSFAATTVKGTWDANNLFCSGTIPGCVKTQDTQKSNIPIIRINSSSNTGPSFDTAGSIMMYPNSSYRYCATAKGRGTLVIGPTGNIGSGGFVNITTDGYQRVCSDPKINTSQANWRTISGQTVNGGNSRTSISVSSIEVELEYGTPAPAPAK